MDTRLLMLALALAFGGPAHAGEPEPPPPAATPATEAPDVVVEKGYHPDRVVVKAGDAVTLRFLRTEYSGCTREVVFPTLGLRRELPTGQLVTIDLGAQAAGEIPFHCGMNMIHGVVVVEAGE